MPKVRAQQKMARDVTPCATTDSAIRIPDLFVVNWHTTITGKPNRRAHIEANHKRIVVRVKDGGFVDVAFADDFKNANPTRQLGHVANKSVTDVNLLGCGLLCDAKPGDIAIRVAERLVGFRRE